MADAGAAGGDAGLGDDVADGGCCSGSRDGAWPLVLAVALLLRRPRRALVSACGLDR